MQHSLLVFEIVFYRSCNITDCAYRGWEGGVGRWGWAASPRRENTAIRAQTVVLCSQQMTGMYTNHRIDRDGHWQQFGTRPILISAPQWACWACNAPTGFHRVGKKPSVKADLAIYSQAVDVRGRCMSESLRLGHNLDFSSCDIMVGFHKSSHIYTLCYQPMIVRSLGQYILLLTFCNYS